MARLAGVDIDLKLKEQTYVAAASVQGGSIVVTIPFGDCRIAAEKFAEFLEACK